MGRFKNIIGDEGSTAPLTTFIAYSAYNISLLALFICLHSGIYVYYYCSTVRALQEYSTWPFGAELVVRMDGTYSGYEYQSTYGAKK